MKVLTALGVGAVAVMAGFAVFARWCQNSPAVPKDKVAQVHPGLTMPEVEAVLGKPRRTGRSEEGLWLWTYGRSFKEHMVMVTFDEARRVRSVVHCSRSDLRRT